MKQITVYRMPLFLKNGNSWIIALTYAGLLNILYRKASASGPTAIIILMLESLSDGIRTITITPFAVIEARVYLEKCLHWSIFCRL